MNGRPSLTTKHNGIVILDPMMHSLWEIAEGRSLDEIILEFKTFGSEPLTTAAGIGCLVEAGLLEREPPYERAPSGRISSNDILENSPLISAVIVSYNGVEWLGPCFDSLLVQSYPKIEIILVDNGSGDGTVAWVRSHYPFVQIIEISQPVALAQAINRGCASGKGEYYLVLNQDVWLDRSCVAEMMTKFRGPCIAACASSLHFMWAPTFINGIGNHYRVSSWGSDNAIGHLDLGQFDSWVEVPSVCFAAALISSQAWKEVGPLDDGFPMYYEDSEWSYRARLYGYHLAASPSACVYHAMGGHHANFPAPLSMTKLSNVVYGRLRFSARLLSPSRKIKELVRFTLQDIIRIIISIFSLKFDRVLSILLGWQNFILNPPKKFSANQQLQYDIFSRDRKIPQPHLWKELPELTWDTVCCEYLPLMISKKTRSIPEIDAILWPSDRLAKCGYLRHLRFALQGGGGLAFLRKIWRDFRWQLG